MPLKIFNVKLILKGDEDWKKCSVITIGTFDGVHLGHRHVLEYCKELSNRYSCTWLLYTFYPHPREVLGNGNFKLLTTQEEKLFLLEKFGVEAVYIKEFTREFAQKTAKEFIEEELIHKLNLRHLVIGYDHQFGKDRKGSYEVLKELATQYNFYLHRLEPKYYGDITISSTKIRHAIEQGNIELANRLLGYSFLMMAEVTDGLKIGRKIGFPTANLKVTNSKKIIPPTGVYVVEVYYKEQQYKGVLNIGYRPTIDIPEHPLTIEVHLLDFNETLYGEKLRIHFLHRLRDDIKFEDINALQRQIEEDIEATRTWFKLNNS